jgi:hypothetical protein
VEEPSKAWQMVVTGQRGRRLGMDGWMGGWMDKRMDR